MWKPAADIQCPAQSICSFCMGTWSLAGPELIQLGSLAALLLSTRFLGVSHMPGISNALLELKSGPLDLRACAGATEPSHP